MYWRYPHNRRDVYEKSKAVVGGGTEAVLRSVQAEIKELRHAKTQGKTMKNGLMHMRGHKWVKTG